ncbi:hypothetical protein ACFSQ3_07700 [Sphingobacterium corticis]|uniref:Uncharacterized protein n=1 Tax=Sphingobacterium corticis TaxID=1812823 RepID=A0ABW5NIX6_9SPHI
MKKQKLNPVLHALSYLLIIMLSNGCSKEETDKIAVGAIIKEYASQQELVGAASGFVDGFSVGGLNDPIFYFNDNYPADIEGMYYNIPFTRNVAGFEYSRQIMGRTAVSYATFEDHITNGANKGYVAFDDERLNESRYRNVSVARAPHNDEKTQTYIAHIDLKESHNSIQILLLHSIRMGFNGNEDEALPAIDEATAVTYFLRQLQDL